MSAPPPLIQPVPMTPIDQAGSASASDPAAAPLPPVGGAPAAPGSMDPLDPLNFPPPAVDKLPAPTKRSNPGPLDRCDQDIQRVLRIDTFDGARFELQKILGPNFVSAHTVYLGSSQHEKGTMYSFGSTLVLGETLLIGRVDQKANVEAQWHQPYSGSFSNYSHRIQAQVTPQESHAVADFERKGETNTAGLKLGLGIYGLSFFQAVTPRIAIGGEVTHLRRNNVMTHVTARARYTDNNHTMVCTATTMGSLSASFLRRVSNRLGLAAELEVATGNLNSHMSFGAEFIMRQAKFTANITSTGTIQTTLQDIVGNNSFLLLSATVDHRSDTYKFGAGIQLG